MKNPLSRHRKSPAPQSGRPSPVTPWWVRWFTNGGRPVVAVVVLIMCAPGEHHLAVLAGWDGRLAWGMAAVLAAYAGIAASVASNRPGGAPGKKSAVAGAFISLGAAMAAQPVSHLFVTGWLSATPHAPWPLVVVVSCAPPLVFGHLLHLAATPIAAPRDTEPPATAPRPAPQRAPRNTVAPAAAPDLLAVEIEEAMAPVATDFEGLRLLTVADVAALKGVREGTVRSWVSRGRLAVASRDANGRSHFHPNAVAELD